MVTKKRVKKAIKKGKKTIHRATKTSSMPDLGKFVSGAVAGVAAVVGVKKLQDKKTRNKLKKEINSAANKFHKEMLAIEKKFSKEYPEVKKELVAARAKLETAVGKGLEHAQGYVEKAHNTASKRVKTTAANAHKKRAMKKKIRQTAKTAAKKKTAKKTTKKAATRRKK